ncbi:MAG TPA: glucosaminidase domain-containing protein [Pantanalinema sp.]
MSYTIRTGDNLDSIAKRFGTTVKSLARLNGIRDPQKIRAGDDLKLPGDHAVLSGSKPGKLSSRHPSSGSDAPAGKMRGDRLALSSPQPAAPAPSLEATPQPTNAFLKEMLPAALKIQQRYGIPAATILAQAALESNWGRSAIGKYNVFGIKGEGSLGSISTSTKEHLRGQWRRMRDGFAKFGSFEEAFEAYAKVIHNGSHSRAVAAKSNPVAFARALQGSYATDPKYASKLISIMRSQDLI